MAATSGVSLKGYKRRKGFEKGYFETRIPGLASGEKFYCTKIKSPEQGAFCYDLVQRYNESGVIGQKRKAAVKLNYEEYSRTLPLEPLRSDFDIMNSSHKEEAMEIILKQAQAAAKNLPENLRRSTPVVGSPSPSNRSSSHQNVHSELLVAKQDSPGVCTNQLNSKEIFDLSRHCDMSYTSKVIERETLERMVADINEDSGIVCPPESCRDDFTDFMALLKQLMTIDEKIPGKLEMDEQGYKSEDSKCLELRKLLKDHNLKVVDKILMKDDNDSLGRQRANEVERLPPLPENCQSEEQNEYGVSVLDSDGFGPPAYLLADARPFGTDRTMPPAMMGVSQCVVPHDFRPPLVAKQDLLGLCTNQLNLQEISELSHHCNISYTFKVMERELLGTMVADINEDSGIIRPPEPRPDKFTDSMALLKQLLATLEMAEQGYKSEDSKYSELRKFLDDHNLKVISKILMADENDSLGRQRANEDERLPPLPGDCQFEEQNEYGVPGNPLAPDWSSDWIPKFYGRNQEFSHEGPDSGISPPVIPTGRPYVRL